MQIRCIRVYNDYFIDKAKFLSDNSLVMAKKAILKEINAKSKSDLGFSFRTSTRFHVKIPLSSSHVNHPVGESSTIGQYVDKRVVDKIYDLVKQNITNLSEVQRSLDTYVREDLFFGHPEERRPKKTNRRYYPCRQDLRNHIAKAISAVKYCDDDQEALGKKIEDWQTKSPKSNFFYRTRDAVINEKDEPRPRTPEETFLFVHQEPWQQQMLERYGSELALMDATYKTTRYAIPLFFVCVHTNVGYKVVAEFICQSEDQASISEALAIIKGWNPAWNPAYFMVDYSNAEIAALEQQFPKSLVYICDFHRLQAMYRWSKSKKNGLSSAEQEIFLVHMKSITYASTVDKFEKRVSALKESRLYKEKPNVQNYLNNTWLSCYRRYSSSTENLQI